MKSCQHIITALLSCTIVLFLTGDVASQKRRTTTRSSPPSQNKDLSRPRAAVLIKADPKFKFPYCTCVPVGRFWSNDYSDSTSVKKQLDNVEPLQEKGILTLSQTGKTQYSWREYLVEFTPTGNDESKSWLKGSAEETFGFLYGMAQFGLPGQPDATLFRIPLADRQLMQITGIVFDPSHTRAQVDFTWKWSALPRAKLLPNKVPADSVRNMAAACALYDDGWRCSPIWPQVMVWPPAMVSFCDSE